MRSYSTTLDLLDVKGEAQACRTLEIAAAGGHKLLLSLVNPSTYLLKGVAD
ncbi:MAG: ATP-binding protein [Pseudanabaenales cyanobacterium]|nr:ATP-binding protein [Pseudanabaenales cyanobacterium]